MKNETIFDLKRKTIEMQVELQYQYDMNPNKKINRMIELLNIIIFYLNVFEKENKEGENV